MTITYFDLTCGENVILIRTLYPPIVGVGREGDVLGKLKEIDIMFPNNHLSNTSEKQIKSCGYNFINFYFPSVYMCTVCDYFIILFIFPAKQGPSPLRTKVEIQSSRPSPAHLPMLGVLWLER